jgi:hypothetical protein
MKKIISRVSKIKRNDNFREIIKKTFVFDIHLFIFREGRVMETDASRILLVSLKPTYGQKTESTAQNQLENFPRQC